MILIVDSGSTKTQWVAVENGSIAAEVTSAGINPFFVSYEDIIKDIQDNVVAQLPRVEQVYYYGAGCVPDKIPILEGALAHCFLSARKIEVYSDLVGAARALCGRNAGIACILGTGANTCYWDGERVVKNVSAGGFILGDEGSGGVLGKYFASDLLKGLLSPELTEKFYSTTNLTPAEIIDRVYRKPFPNRFLAGFTRFMNDNRDDVQVAAIIKSCFTAFFTRCIMQYDTTMEVNIIGSVGYYFRDFLEEAAAPLGIRLGKIEQSPIAGLIEFHK